MTDAAGAAQGVRREVETAFRARPRRLLNSMDVVQREEFEAVRDMAVKARAENKALAARIDALEARIARTARRDRRRNGADAARQSPSEKIIRLNFSTKHRCEKRFSVNRLPGLHESS